MFETLALFLWIMLTGVASIGGYIVTKRFVQERLRYVDAVHKRRAPLLAGTAAGVLALPIVAVFPFIGVGTAVLFGLGVGKGVSSGRREFKQLPP